MSDALDRLASSGMSPAFFTKRKDNLQSDIGAEMSNSYEGKEVVISYDDKICTHAGECVRGLPQVFDAKRSPWIQPGDISYEAAEQVIRRCPSGALKVRRV